MQFRHEVKHEIDGLDMRILRQRLRAVMQPDPHARDGVYEIRSLYFDTPDDRALRDKIDGVNIREKYRLRLYNSDTSLIRLERKYKCGALGFKETAVLTDRQAEAIISGDIGWMASQKDAVLLGFYSAVRRTGLRPKVIVEYTREPFIFPAGNVRVTLDYNLRTGLCCTDFLSPGCRTIPAKDSPNLLEVKWDSYLPDCIRDIVQLEGRQNGAFSKYAACRMYE